MVVGKYSGNYENSHIIPAVIIPPEETHNLSGFNTWISCLKLNLRLNPTNE